MHSNGIVSGSAWLACWRISRLWRIHLRKKCKGKSKVPTLEISRSRAPSRLCSGRWWHIIAITRGRSRPCGRFWARGRPAGAEIRGKTRSSGAMIRSAICLALFPLLLMAQTVAETNDPAIRAGMDRWMDAWNHHDANAFAAVFSEDADFANRRGTGARVAVRRSKIEEFHAPVLATICSKSHQE